MPVEPVTDPLLVAKMRLFALMVRENRPDFQGWAFTIEEWADEVERREARTPAADAPRLAELRAAVADLTCVRMHWGAARPCDEYDDGRELCAPCRCRRVLALMDTAPSERAGELDAERLARAMSAHEDARKARLGHDGHECDFGCAADIAAEYRRGGS